ncbi:glycosyl transferase [Histomonas meleagridis]|uniref:glycosyl transferase n=1 Tax=Histomonas meleagridis TaxID=135588 RepID=UPI0035596A90|nr:glycosyl transferase [Histomonas meleagridis]KAH0798840.1 glycosyl transferase [Histomonas meleagridis]
MGAVALAHTLQKYHGEKYGMLCLVTPDVNNTWVEILQQWWEVIKVPNFKPKSNFRRSWAKLFLWDQIQYDKLVYFDSDILIFNPVDELFQYPQLSCASDPSPPQICNTGVLVIEPKSGLLNRMQAASKIDGNVMGIGDQAFINFFFNGFTPLPPKFNILRIQTRGLSFAIKNNLTKAVHYVCKKPWKCGRQETCGCGYPSFNQKWWDIWDEACANHKCIESWSE